MVVGFTLRFAELVTQDHLIVAGIMTNQLQETSTIAAISPNSSSLHERQRIREKAAEWILERFNASVVLADSSGWVVMPTEPAYERAIAAWSKIAPDKSGTIDEKLVVGDPIGALAEQACALLRDALQGMRMEDFRKFRWAPGGPIHLPSGSPFAPKRRDVPREPRVVLEEGVGVDNPREALRAFNRRRFPWRHPEEI